FSEPLNSPFAVSVSGSCKFHKVRRVAFPCCEKLYALEHNLTRYRFIMRNRTNSKVFRQFSLKSKALRLHYRTARKYQRHCARKQAPKALRINPT
ncbi:hypothetical protein, partial [Pseudomonas kitaguniensis]|uniref:hypothetical protein n=1 Tax=Pseudomonas kitaguniensis TaxID=2607908 RepID=UPI0019D60B1C